MVDGASAPDVREGTDMGFDDFINKSKKLFEDSKDKVTEFVESEKGQQTIEQSKKIFEDGKEKVTEFFDSDKGQDGDKGQEGDKSEPVTDQVFDSTTDVAKKISPDQFDGHNDAARDPADRAVSNDN
jgi:hypothetical protein